MDKQLENFLSDLIIVIQEKYNDTLDISTLDISTNEKAEDKAYRLGSNFAYFDILSVIESQLIANQLDLGAIKTITPILGRKI